MQEPNFCEGQLQQMINTEIFSRLRNQGLLTPFPRIIPPYWEDRFGWDTAFYIPWLGPRNEAQYGCNLFIQYKLSSMYVSPGAYGWNEWRQAFFRFNLGYRRNKQWDFTQRDHLIELADKGFVVVYVTNHILTFSELTTIARRDELCEILPVLRVNNNLCQHLRVSFTSDSAHFCLHSKEEYTKKETIAVALSEIQPSMLADDINPIFEVLMRYEETTGIREGTVRETIPGLIDNKVPELVAKIAAAWWFLRRYLNVYWIRFAWDKKETGN